VIATAEARGARTCGHAFDQAPLAPRGYVTGADYHWSDMFTGFVEARRAGGVPPAFLTGGYDRDYVRSSPFGAGATEAARAAATGAIEAMKKNDPIFVGPLDDNAGKRVVPAGTVHGPYAESLQRMDYLLDGVISQVR
jgi:simple sugar transport system substrate-binding protein